MSKSLKVLLFVISIALIIGSVFYALYIHIPVTTLNYEESDTVLINPSRGFYVQFDTGHLKGIESLRDKGITLVLLAFDIAEFVDTDISRAKLEELSLALDAVRANGLKAILRTAYGFYDPQEYQDPHSLIIILDHIQQLSPILSQHKEVLLSVQAGFLGPWGEWHHSNLENKAGQLDADTINGLLKALCEAVPSPISIAVRTPGFIRKIDDTQIDITRIAFHNDALLSGDSDMNTYDLTSSTRQGELNFIELRNHPVANGGEMTNLSAYTQADQALLEFSKLNLTYLNHEYNKAVLDEWAKTPYDDQRFIDIITSTLGYRWSLRSATMPVKLRKDQTLKLRLTLFNSGFAAIALPYEAELVVFDDSGILQVLPFEGVNLQDLKAQDTLNLKIGFKPTPFSEHFTIGLRLKENQLGLQDDPRYKVALANDTLKFHDGINDMFSYRWDGKSNYILETK